MNWLWVAAGIARVVVGPGSTPPEIEPDDAVLFIERPNTCLPDAGVPDAAIDGGAITDAGSALPDAAMAFAPPPDAAVLPDAGSDGGIPDAGTTSCGDSVMMIVQPHFSVGARGSHFALLYVTPATPVMRLESPTTFDDLAAATAPEIDTRIVEVPDPALGTRCEGCVSTSNNEGGGCGYESNPSWNPPTLDGGVGASTIQTIGPYEVATRQPSSRTELAKWLTDLGYAYETTDLDALEPYLTQGWAVVAVRVAQESSFTGGLQPLSMTWAGSDITVPLRLASQPSLTVYIAADHRYELTGAHVSFAGYTGASFVTRNEVDNLASDLTAYRATNDNSTRDVHTIYQEEHVPVTKDCDDQGCCQSGKGTTNGILWAAALLTVVGRPRRSGRRRRAARTPAAPCDSSPRSCSRDG
jgi:hypothetical protein